MPLDDHVLLLQLERAVEAVHDEFEAVMESDADFADASHDHDERYADTYHNHDREYGSLEKSDDHESRLDDLAERLITLEERVDALIDALRGTANNHHHV